MIPAEIAIIGAGVGGLTLAASLKKFGIRAHIFEQARSFGPVGSGLQLTANAVKGLQGLGLDHQLRQQGFVPAEHLSREWDTGEVTNILPIGVAIESKYGVPDIAIHRHNLHAALVSKIDPDQVSFRKKLTHIRSSEDGVELHFEDGQSCSADAVIGADGLHSRVRDSLFGPERPRYTGKVAYRSILPAARVRSSTIDPRVKWWGPDRHIVSYFTTAARDQIYFTAVTPEPEFQLESWSTLGDKAKLLEAFEGFHPQIRAVLEAGEEIRQWGLFDREPITCWGRGLVTLLGDACHPMPPFIAQGAASSIEDAIVLARCIANHGLSRLDQTFRDYEAIRSPRTARMQNTARQNTWLRKKTETDWIYAYDAWTANLTD
jgi:6-hydroxynicotinate 3-monooxygenase